MKYNKFNLGHVEAVFNKLGGIHGVERFLAGKTIVQAVPQTFKVWRTIKVGTHPSKDVFIKDVDVRCIKTEDSGPKGSIAIRHYSHMMLHNSSFEWSTKEQEVDLVVLTPSELGFKEAVKRKEVYNWAFQLGLRLCLSEIGIQLAFRLNSEPDGDYPYPDLIIAMEPIIIPDEKMYDYVYRIRDDKFYGLKIDWDLGDFVLENTKLVFQLPKK